MTVSDIQKHSEIIRQISSKQLKDSKGRHWTWNDKTQFWDSQSKSICPVTLWVLTDDEMIQHLQNDNSE